MSAVSSELTKRVTELSKCPGYNFLTVNLPTGEWFQVLNNGDGTWIFNLGIPEGSPLRRPVVEWCKLQSMTVTQTEDTSILATTARRSVQEIVTISLSLLGLHGVSSNSTVQLDYDLHCDPTRHIGATPKRATVPVGLLVAFGIQSALLLVIYFLLQAGGGGVVRIPAILFPLYLFAQLTFIAIGIEPALSIVLTFVVVCIAFDLYLYKRGDLD